MAAQRTSARSANRHVVKSNRNFRLLFFGDALSQFGFQITLLALPLIGLVSLQASVFQVGLLTACVTFPLLVFGLLAGALVDRSRRRTVMICCDLLRALGLASVAAAWALDVLTMAQLYAVALLIGTASVFSDVAHTSYLPRLVPRERIIEGNAALKTMHSVAGTAGPSAGGVLVQVLSAPFALLASVIGYLWSAACLRFIDVREKRPSRAERMPLIGDIRAGLRFLLGHRLLRRIMMCSAGMNFFTSVNSVVLITFLVRELNVAPSTMGVMLSATGVGGVVGGLAAPRLIRALGEGPVLCGAAVLSSVPVLLMPLTGADWRLVLLGTVLLTTAFGGVIYNITVLSFRQATTPDELLGRINASARVLIAGVMPLGNLLGGALGQALGAGNTMWISGTGAALSSLWILLSPIRHLRKLEPNMAQAAP